MKKDLVLKGFYVEIFQKLIATNKVEAVNAKDEQKNDRNFYILHVVTKQAKRDWFTIDLLNFKMCL